MGPPPNRFWGRQIDSESRCVHAVNRSQPESIATETKCLAPSSCKGLFASVDAGGRPGRLGWPFASFDSSTRF